jgi:hypothetical protein
MALTSMLNVQVMIWQIEDGQAVANVHCQSQLNPISLVLDRPAAQTRGAFRIRMTMLKVERGLTALVADRPIAV